MRSIGRAWAVGAVLLASMVAASQAGAVECAAVKPWINEINYDHDANILFNHDRDEFLEIAAPAGTDLTGYRLIVIEGSTDVCFSGFGSAGEAYIDQPLSGPAAIVGDENGGGLGFVSVCFTSTSTGTAVCDFTLPGVASDSNLKNGSLTQPAGNCADGVLLLDPQGNLVDAVGYEGQVANTGTYGAYFQPATTPYFLYPPIYDDGYGDDESVYRNDSAAARASAATQWSVSPVGGATPSSQNPGQALACTTGPVCGNGSLESGEACDDGNISDGDGCSGVCEIEFCGDGVLQAGIGEACDDGNDQDGDGCSASCLVEVPVCGDGSLDAGEQCDDGNLVSEDGCSALCQDEFCGDGVQQPGLGEACDDGNATSEDGCSATCQAEFCGDGTLQPGLGEACDDGNVVDLDGCSSICEVEIGVCGNGLVEFGEACDDANQISGDGCSSVCADEPSGVCGDGVVHPTEGCDDGDFVNGDGCDDACQVELAGVCGDAVVHPTEECDDGNQDVFDGCLPSCELSNAVPATSPLGALALVAAIAGLGLFGLGVIRRADA